MAAPAVAFAAPTSPVPVVLPAGRRPALAAGALLAAALLILLSVQGWAPRLLPHAPPPAGPPATPLHTPSVDAATAAAAAVHVPLPVPGRPGELRVSAPDYTAGFDAAGVSFAPAGAGAPVRIDLTSVGRGTEALALDRSGWQGSASGASRTVHPGVREQVTTRAGEVEWDVVLAAPPAGRGDLVVRAGLSGVTGVPVREQVDGRPSWRLPSAGGPVRLGETVVKDADGTVLHRGLPSVGPDGLTVRVPSSALRTAHYPVTVDPTLGTTQPLTDSARNYNPSIAYDSTHDRYLVVYTVSDATDTDVYGILVNGDGVPVNLAKQLSFRDQIEVVPDVAWNGTNWLVVWEHYFSNQDQDIRGTLVNAAGDPIGSEIGIAVGTATEQAPAVAAGGSSFLVTWRDYISNDYEVRGRRVNGSGTVLDTVAMDFSQNSTLADKDPDVAFNGTVWVVTWESQFSLANDWVVWVRVVGTGGGVGSANIVAFRSQIPRHPAVASNGSRFLVVWDQPSTTGGGQDVWGAHVNPNNLSDYTDFPISTASTDQTDPAVAYNGAYLVSWTDKRNPPDPDVYAARVNSNGTVADPNGFQVIVTGADEDTTAVGAGSGKWTVGWESGSGNATTIKIRTVSSK